VVERASGANCINNPPIAKMAAMPVTGSQVLLTAAFNQRFVSCPGKQRYSPVTKTPSTRISAGSAGAIQIT